MSEATGYLNFIFRIWPWLARFFSRPYRNSRKLAGTWSYECTIRKGMFIDKHFDGIERNAHGGECTIIIEKGLIATRISIIGERKWAANFDLQGNKQDFYYLPVPVRWEDITAAFVSDTKVMYKYAIDNSLVGITFLDIKYDGKSKKLKPAGEFYYLPEKTNLLSKPDKLDSDHKPDILENVQLSTLFKRMLASKETPESSIALRSTGEIRFYKD